MLGFTAADSGFDPVVTSLAGFAGGRRPQALGGRTPMPTKLVIAAVGEPAHKITTSIYYDVRNLRGSDVLADHHEGTLI